MSRFIAASVGFLAVFAAGLVRGDTVRLTGGGTLRGQVLAEKSTAKSIVLKLDGGRGEVTLDRAQIQEIISDKTPTQQYEEMKAAAKDTAEDHFRLAEWCKDNRLTKQRREHLLRAVELEPDHERARSALGHVRRDGKWLTPEEQKTAQGLVRYNGRYMTPQEKELLERKKKSDEQVREWHQKVRMWKTWLQGSDAGRAEQAKQNLLAISDAAAVEPVAGHLGKEKNDAYRVLMCQILAHIEGEDATMKLIVRCLADVSDDVRNAAIDALVERDDRTTGRTLARVLTADDPTIVRRAALAIKAIGDITTVPALINALITKQPQLQVVGTQGGTFGAVSRPEIVDYDVVVSGNTVVYTPVIGQRTQGSGVVAPIVSKVLVPIENPEVLDALRTLTEQDYGYNQDEWRKWLAAEAKREELRQRRRLEEK